VTVDVGGRIMIPKALRDRLGLRAGSTITVSEHDGVIELVPRPVDVEIVQRARVAVLQPPTTRCPC
jgi:AbrB family looped-hinge helix DNA binding protein